MALGQRAPQQVRVFRHAPAHVEEGRVDAVALERVEYLAPTLDMRPVVEGEGDFRQGAVAMKQDRAIWVVEVFAMQAAPPVHRVQRLAPGQRAVLVIPEEPTADEQEGQQAERASNARPKEPTGQRIPRRCGIGVTLAQRHLFTQEKYLFIIRTPPQESFLSGRALPGNFRKGLMNCRQTLQSG